MESFRTPEELRPDIELRRDVMIYDDVTDEVVAHIAAGELSQFADDGRLTGRGRSELTARGDVVPEGTFYAPDTLPVFRGGRRIGELVIEHTRSGHHVGRLSPEPFHADATLGQSSEDTTYAPLPSGNRRFINGVIQSIFDGRHDLADVDQLHLLDHGTPLPSMLWEQFINAPGHNGGRSSIRHIFAGDKLGGIHVPAFAEPDEIAAANHIDGWQPFNALISLNGAVRMRVVTDEFGHERLEPKETSLFPPNFDSMTVLSTILHANQQRRDSHSVGYRGGAEVFDVPVQTDTPAGEMLIRLVIDDNKHAGKIRTAFPIV